MKNFKMLAFLLLTALLVGRFTYNLRQRAARAFPDNFSGITFREHFTLIWDVLRWSGPYLAPEGVYYMTGYTSVPTPTGPIGLLPGQELRVVRETGGRLIVTAPAVTGPRELEVPRSAVTDDLDLARNLAVRDWHAHQEFRDQIAAEEAERERVRLGLYRQAAANVEAAERNRMGSDASRIGNHRSALHDGPTVPGVNASLGLTPYYQPSPFYLAPNAVPGATSSNAGTSSTSGSRGGTITLSAASSTPRVHTTWRPGSASDPRINPPRPTPSPSPTPR